MSYFTYKSDTDRDFGLLQASIEDGRYGALDDAEALISNREYSTIFSTWNNINASNMSSILPQFPRILPTKYDSPYLHAILESHILTIEKASKKLGLNIKKFDNYSCVPTGGINAQVVDILGASQQFILFDSQTFTMCHLFAKAMAECIVNHDQASGIGYSINIEDVSNHIENNPDSLKRLLQFLEAISFVGKPAAAEPYIISVKSLPIATILIQGMELFLVAHEFGHLYIENIAEYSSQNNSLLENEFPFNKDHLAEFQADIIALSLTTTAMAEMGIDFTLSYSIIEMLFLMLDLVDCYRFKCGTILEVHKFTKSASHPPNIQRRLFLREMLKDTKLNEQELEQVINFAKMQEQTILFLAQVINKSRNL